MDNPDRLGGAETNTVTRELVVNMVAEASLVVLTVRNTQPEQIGPDQTRRLEEIKSQQSGLVVKGNDGATPPPSFTISVLCCQYAGVG